MATKNRRNRNQTAVINQLLSREHKPGPDMLMETLREPIPEHLIHKIVELKQENVPRSQIAKKLGISKIRINKAIEKIGG
ncbi:hypothetical protein D3C87_1406350 [compost metagenome]